MTFLTLLLQATTGGGIMQLVFPVAIGLVLYFFMIRPQQRKTADAKAFRESLVKGTRVVTIGGMHGLLVEVGPERCCSKWSAASACASTAAPWRG